MYAAEVTGLAVISKNDYRAVLEKIETKNETEKYDFLKKIPIFNQLKK